MTEDHMATAQESSIRNQHPSGPQPGPATDPVCGMQVVGADETLTIDYKGHQYQFCSTTCRDTFRTEPEKFV